MNLHCVLPLECDIFEKEISEGECNHSSDVVECNEDAELRVVRRDESWEIRHRVTSLSIVAGIDLSQVA